MHPPELTDETLIALALGELNDDLAVPVRAAVQASPAARARLEALTRTSEALRSLGALDSQMSTTDTQRARLASLMQGRGSSWLADAAARARETVATIVAHTLRAPTLGYRGAAAGTIVRAEADGVALDFRFSSEASKPGLVLVQGQADSGSRVLSLRAFHEAAGDPTDCVLDADGYFEAMLAPGVYRWELTTEAGTVVVEAVNVSTPELESGR